MHKKIIIPGSIMRYTLKSPYIAVIQVDFYFQIAINNKV